MGRWQLLALRGTGYRETSQGLPLLTPTILVLLCAASATVPHWAPAGGHACRGDVISPDRQSAAPDDRRVDDRRRDLVLIWQP